MTDKRTFDAQDSPPRRAVSRRTVVTTAAWAVPVVAAAVALPLASASVACAGGTVTTEATTAGPGTLDVTIPACATNITFTVIGGAGGSSAGWGGNGALITGSIVPTGSDIQLTLTAGQGGWGRSRGTSFVNRRPQGYGQGGLGGNRYNYQGSGAWAVDGGYGGAGSAILVGSQPLVVAGGGGGSANAQSSTGYGATAGAGGNAGATPAAGGAGTRGGGAQAGGGRGATDATPGAGGVAVGGLANTNGTAGSGGTGGSGRQSGNGTNGANGGGGGGGRAGGGGGSTVWDGTNNTGAGGGGGGGSSFVGTANGVTAAGDIGTANNASSGARPDGGPGKVTVTWS